MLSLLVLTALLQVPGTSPAPSSPSSSLPPWANAADLDILDDERDSLRGVTRLQLSVRVPEVLEPKLQPVPLRSLLAFMLDQAGIAVLQTRALEDPLLVVNIDVSHDDDVVSSEWMAVRVSADLMQLVRLADHAGKARVMLASTWHAGSHGVISSKANAEELQMRVRDVVGAFIADHRAAHDVRPPGSPRLTP